MATTAEIRDLIVAHQIQLKYTLANLSDHHLRRGLFTFFGSGPKTQKLKTELKAILSGLIPSFQDIEKITTGRGGGNIKLELPWLRSS